MRLPACPKRPGRPKNAAKRAAILAAASELFMRSGYEAVTMEAVAAAACVSKMTVYSHFGDKESLFVAVVRAFSARMLATTAAVPAGGGFGQRLETLGRSFLGLLLNPRAVRMRHTLGGVLSADPALAKRFYEAGPGHMRAALATMIAAAMACGDLRPDDPRLAAEDLLSLWTGDMQNCMAYGLLDPPTEEDVAARARRGTEVFLRAYRA